MSGTSSLCAFCRFIPFDIDTLEKLRSRARSKFRGRGPRPRPLDFGGETRLIPEDRTLFALGKTERVLSSSCPFCKLVAAAVRDIRRISGWEDLRADTPLKLRWNLDGQCSKGVFTLNDKRDVYICFVAERGMSPSTENLIRSSASVINPPAIQLEPSEVARWIANCEDTHGAGCNADTGIKGAIKDSYRGLPLMRFVDVHQKCIVERTEVVRYVALSYVWGATTKTVRLTKMNQRQMRRPGALAGLLLPATIRDAMELTRGCGEQYLWVDALCIVQNDVEDLDAGTRAMDLVYELSVFTIVAASGYDATYGLPGLRPGLRTAPSYAEVAPGVRLGIMSELTPLVWASCYATRGWTMQEELLSKRILYFVDDKIFFRCPFATMFEGCSDPLYQPAGSLLRMDKPFRYFKILIEDYSMRALTNQDDAFRAISGMLGHISATQQWQIIAGLPTIALEFIMFFQRRNHILCRRPGFPSYSWLGWRGAMSVTETVDVFHGWIAWYVLNPSNNALLIDRRPTGREASPKIIECLASNGVIPRIEPDFGLLPGVDFGQKIPSNRGQLRPPRPYPLLCFWTLAVFFDLSSVDYVKGTANLGSTFVPRESAKLTLDGLDDFTLSRPGEFILLSRIDAGEHDDMKYTVMLIDWVDGVAERRGIGYIYPSEIQLSLSPGPIWKEIVLG